jgi:hypothetical protein
MEQSLCASFSIYVSSLKNTLGTNKCGVARLRSMQKTGQLLIDTLDPSAELLSGPSVSA